MLSIERPATLDELKHQALRIDIQYWERQGKKQTTTSIRAPTSSEPSTTPCSNVRSNTSTASKPSEQKDLSGILNATGRLTEAEKFAAKGSLPLLLQITHTTCQRVPLPGTCHNYW